MNEFMVLGFNGDSLPDRERRLDELGSAGWVLVSVDGQVAYLMRDVPRDSRLLAHPGEKEKP